MRLQKPGCTGLSIISSVQPETRGPIIGGEVVSCRARHQILGGFYAMLRGVYILCNRQGVTDGGEGKCTVRRPGRRHWRSSGKDNEEGSEETARRSTTHRAECTQMSKQTVVPIPKTGDS